MDSDRHPLRPPSPPPPPPPRRVPFPRQPPSSADAFKLRGLRVAPAGPIRARLFVQHSARTRGYNRHEPSLFMSSVSAFGDDFLYGWRRAGQIADLPVIGQLRNADLVMLRLVPREESAPTLDSDSRRSAAADSALRSGRSPVPRVFTRPRPVLPRYIRPLLESRERPRFGPCAGTFKICWWGGGGWRKSIPLRHHGTI